VCDKTALEKYERENKMSDEQFEESVEKQVELASDLQKKLDELTAQEEKEKKTICVYLDDGRVYEYQVTGADKAREHVSAIIKGGYRHNDGKNTFEHYPTHRINKVKVVGGVPTKYPDTHTGT